MMRRKGHPRTLCSAIASPSDYIRTSPFSFPPPHVAIALRLSPSLPSTRMSPREQIISPLKLVR